MNSTQIQWSSDDINSKTTFEALKDTSDDPTNVVRPKLSLSTPTKHDSMGRYIMNFEHNNTQYDQRLENQQGEDFVTSWW